MKEKFSKEKYEGIFKITHFCVKWLVRILYVAMIVIVIGLVAVLVIPRSNFSFNTNQLEDISFQFYNLFVRMGDIISEGTYNIKNVLLIAGVVGVVNIGFIQLILIGIRKLIRKVKEGSPFDFKNAEVLRRMGLVFIGGSLVLPLANTTLMSTLVHTFNVISDMRVNFAINLQFVFMGLLIMVLAYVFSYGSYLQEEHDATV